MPAPSNGGFLVQPEQYGFTISNEIEGPFIMDSILMFACEKGYRLIGSNQAKCLENGQWDTSVPECIPSNFILLLIHFTLYFIMFSWKVIWRTSFFKYLFINLPYLMSYQTTLKWCQIYNLLIITLKLSFRWNWVQRSITLITVELCVS